MHRDSLSWVEPQRKDWLTANSKLLSLALPVADRRGWTALCTETPRLRLKPKKPIMILFMTSSTLYNRLTAPLTKCDKGRIWLLTLSTIAWIDLAWDVSISTISLASYVATATSTWVTTSSTLSWGFWIRMEPTTVSSPEKLSFSLWELLLKKKNKLKRMSKTIKKTSLTKSDWTKDD